MPTQAVAQRYSYATVTYIATVAQVAQMKAWNPNLRLFRYRNFEATNASGDVGTYAEFKANGWILKDSTGADLQATDITTEYLVDPGNASYRAWLLAYCQARIAEGYDGVFADCFPRPRTPQSYRIGSKTIINPRTGTTYTSDDWVNDELATISAIQPYCPIVGNGIPQAHDVTGYLQNKTRADRIISSSITGLMIEGPVAWNLSDYNGRSSTVWKSNVDLLTLLNSAGKIVMFSNTGATNLETDAIANFTYCTYVMGVPYSDTQWERYSVKFRGSAFMSGVYWTSLVNLDLGMPTDNVALVGSEYVRHFTGGEVKVNPTAKTSSINVYSTYNLSLSSSPSGVIWKLNGVDVTEGVYPINKDSTVTLSVPQNIEVS